MQSRLYSACFCFPFTATKLAVLTHVNSARNHLLFIVLPHTCRDLFPALKWAISTRANWVLNKLYYCSDHQRIFTRAPLLNNIIELIDSLKISVWNNHKLAHERKFGKCLTYPCEESLVFGLVYCLCIIWKYWVIKE